MSNSNEKRMSNKEDISEKIINGEAIPFSRTITTEGAPDIDTAIGEADKDKSITPAKTKGDDSK